MLDLPTAFQVFIRVEEAFIRALQRRNGEKRERMNLENANDQAWKRVEF